jgi:hypothetical protein
MAAHRNRYVKVILFEPLTTNLIGGSVVGQYGDWILVERPAPKPHAAASKSVRRAPRKPNAHPTSVPSTSPSAEA